MIITRHLPSIERPRRIRLSAARREEIFLAEKGICHLCRFRIEAGEDWDVSHKHVPHALGGEELGVAHRKRCHSPHTAEVTIPMVAKVDRMRQRHLGASETRHKLPCGRNSKYSKPIDGRPKPRQSLSTWHAKMGLRKDGPACPRFSDDGGQTFREDADPGDDDTPATALRTALVASLQEMGAVS